VNLAVVVQARTGSTRLPGKVLLPLAGEPLLLRMLERVKAARTPFTIVVATTTAPEDDAVRDLCAANGIRCYSGHPTDLLDRHYNAALSVGADAVAKVPSDCPLIDPAVIDTVLGYAAAHPADFDFVSNLHPPTYPDGNDVEIMPMKVLETAWKEARKDYEREHTTPFIWEQQERFRIGNVVWATGLDYSMSHRWTIDYAEDYTFLQRVYDRLWTPDRPVFSMQDILALLEREPEIALINARHAGVNWYRHHLGELKTIRADQTRRTGQTEHTG
jgi:spore coat polysaccharide biosynthesis protein SpsF